MLHSSCHNTEIKQLLVNRSNQFQIPLRHACRAARVNYQEFMRTYINRVDSSDTKLAFEQFEKICEVLGVTIRFTFVVKEDHPGQEVRKDLESKYGKNYSDYSEDPGHGDEAEKHDFDPE